MKNNTQKSIPVNSPTPQVALYTDPSPYPKVTGEHDPYTVAILKQDYAGASGELTAITQYIFQNVSTSNDDYFANALLKIAIVEMSHLHMLGDTIETLGGNLRFSEGRRYWNSTFVDYSKSLESMIYADIKAETIAIDNYEKHASITKNQSVRNLLLRIAKDERLHLRFFREMLDKVK